MLTDVIVVTKNRDGVCEEHNLTWDRVRNYARLQIELGGDMDKVVLVVVEGTCIFSSLYGTEITWRHLVAFFG